MRRLLFVIVLLALPASPARAQFRAAAGIEHFHWAEHVDPEVQENGPRFTILLGWRQPGSSPVRAGYQGTVFAGSAHYRGSLLFEPGTAASGTTNYSGTAQEARVSVLAAPNLDVIGGLGFELWLRRLSADQREDFTVTYFRLGVEGSTVTRAWTFAAGLKFPMSVSEDAHLDLLGFDENPKLEPRGKVSGYSDVTYRFATEWGVTGYIDGFHFGESDRVTLTDQDGTSVTLYQPAADLRTLGVRFVRFF
jgi:hypothetical protein